MFRAYVYKLFRSPLLYVSILGIACLCSTEFLNSFGYGSVVYHIEIFLGLAKYRKAVAVFGALPFTANFADEWTNGVVKECIIRRNIKKYAAANLLFCWFSTMLTVLLGMWLFMCFDSLSAPWNIVDNNPYAFIFEGLKYNGHEHLYLLLITSVFSADCAAWAVTGMLLSAFFPNKYVAICTPFVASYVIERITTALRSPWLDLYNLATSYIPASFFNGSDLLGFLYCVGIFAAIAAVCGIIFYFVVKRKVQNGLT